MTGEKEGSPCPLITLIGHFSKTRRKLGRDGEINDVDLLPFI